MHIVWRKTSGILANFRQSFSLYRKWDANSLPTIVEAALEIAPRLQQSTEENVFHSDYW